MAKYVGVKVVDAVPMTRNVFNRDVKGIPEDILAKMLEINSEDKEGYLVTYEDGYASWSPKETFDKHYMKVGENNTITETNVKDFVAGMEVSQWGDKTTIVNATLQNGFVITESSSCVDPENFNMDIGASICRDKIYNQVWRMLGFVLQCGLKGIKKSN